MPAPHTYPRPPSCHIKHSPASAIIYTNKREANASAQPCRKATRPQHSRMLQRATSRGRFLPYLLGSRLWQQCLLSAQTHTPALHNRKRFELLFTKLACRALQTPRGRPPLAMYPTTATRGWPQSKKQSVYIRMPVSISALAVCRRTIAIGVRVGTAARHRAPHCLPLAATANASVSEPIDAHAHTLRCMAFYYCPRARRHTPSPPPSPALLQAPRCHAVLLCCAMLGLAWPGARTADSSTPHRCRVMHI